MSNDFYKQYCLTVLLNDNDLLYALNFLLRSHCVHTFD